MDNILIVEDDEAIALGLIYSLEQEGYRVDRVGNKSAAEAAVKAQGYDLYLLDITLPDGNGYEICKLIKQQGDKPVIFLTACDDEVNVVMGLDMGADDYITKPFRIKELISRIKSVLRRYQVNAPKASNYQIRDITINVNDAKVYKNGKELFLTAMEYRLLLTFINNQGQILSRNQLLEGIWDISGDFVNDNTLTVYIKRLREKLEGTAENSSIIETVRGLGYRMGE